VVNALGALRWTQNRAIARNTEKGVVHEKNGDNPAPPANQSTGLTNKQRSGIDYFVNFSITRENLCPKQ
jgi:hypothetical protein